MSFDIDSTSGFPTEAAVDAICANVASTVLGALAAIIALAVRFVRAFLGFILRRADRWW
jgi:hypothetical protein